MIPALALSIIAARDSRIAYIKNSLLYSIQGNQPRGGFALGTSGVRLPIALSAAKAASGQNLLPVIFFRLAPTKNLRKRAITSQANIVVVEAAIANAGRRHAASRFIRIIDHHSVSQSMNRAWPFFLNVLQSPARATQHSGRSRQRGLAG
jgi:hypothetical protein